MHGTASLLHHVWATRHKKAGTNKDSRFSYSVVERCHCASATFGLTPPIQTRGQRSSAEHDWESNSLLLAIQIMFNMLLETIRKKTAVDLHTFTTQTCASWLACWHLAHASAVWRFHPSPSEEGLSAGEYGVKPRGESALPAVLFHQHVCSLKPWPLQAPHRIPHRCSLVA